jgi:hypothetical protein
MGQAIIHACLLIIEYISRLGRIYSEIIGSTVIIALFALVEITLE